MASNIEKALYYQVINFAGMSALISDRFYPVRLKQTINTFPAAIYQLIPGSNTKEHGNPTVLPRPRVQITIYSNNFDDTVAVDKLIKTAIDGKRGNWGTGSYVTYIQSCLSESTPRDDSDNDTGLYWRSRDYLIMYTE